VSESSQSVSAPGSRNEVKLPGYQVQYQYSTTTLYGWGIIDSAKSFGRERSSNIQYTLTKKETSRKLAWTRWEGDTMQSMNHLDPLWHGDNAYTISTLPPDLRRSLPEDEPDLIIRKMLIQAVPLDDNLVYFWIQRFKKCMPSTCILLHHEETKRFIEGNGMLFELNDSIKNIVMIEKLGHESPLWRVFAVHYEHQFIVLFDWWCTQDSEEVKRGATAKDIHSKLNLGTQNNPNFKLFHPQTPAGYLWPMMDSSMLALITAYTMINDIDPMPYITSYIPWLAFEKILHRLVCGFLKGGNSQHTKGDLLAPLSDTDTEEMINTVSRDYPKLSAVLKREAPLHNNLVYFWIERFKACVPSACILLDHEGTKGFIEEIGMTLNTISDGIKRVVMIEKLGGESPEWRVFLVDYEHQVLVLFDWWCTHDSEEVNGGATAMDICLKLNFQKEKFYQTHPPEGWNLTIDSAMLALLTAYALINDVDPLKYITDHIPLNAFEKILHRLLHEYGSELKSLNNDPGGIIVSIHHQMEMDEYDSDLKSLNNETGGSIGSEMVIHETANELLEPLSSDQLHEYGSDLKSLNNEPGGSIGSIDHQMEMVIHETANELLEPLSSDQLHEYGSDLKSLNNESGGSIGSIDHQMEMVIPERANELLKPLSSDQLCRVDDAINKQTALKTLQPERWLSDDVINNFFENLSTQKREKSEGKECHFFSTFLWTMMMQTEHPDEHWRGTYDYNRVRGWSKVARGDDIFNLDKLFIPIHANRNHWLLAVAFMQTKVIQIYDSLQQSGKTYLGSIFQYLQDEHKERKKCPLPDVGKWELIPCQQTTPAQQNG
jgi:hypothetical protein